MAERSSQADQENKLQQQDQQLSYSEDRVTVATESTDLDLSEKEKTSPQSEEETECPGCQSLGVVTLTCSHKLCPSCIDLSQKEMGREGCTICYGSQLMDSVLQGLLGALFHGQPRRDTRTVRPEEAISRAAAEETVKAAEGGNPEKQQQCLLHGEPLREFCLEKEELLCHKCSVSDQGPPRCCSIEEALLLCKSQSVTITQVLREEFEKMQQFLRDEEATLTSELKQEEEEKIQRVEQKISKIGNNIQILKSSIGELEDVMESEDIFFLKNYRSASKRTPHGVDEYKEEFGTLLDVPKYQSCMQHHVWERMLRVIHYFPVTLDPNTGSACLTVSADLSTVSVCDEQPLPDNTDRCVNPQGILASVGFSSGSDLWEVEVGDNSHWSLGVARDSIGRKDLWRLDDNPGEPSGGVWTVSLSSGLYHASPGHSSPLTLRRRPSRIRIQLDWERGCLTFSDANGNALIHRFKKQWSGTLRPYFSTTCSKHPLKIIESRVTVAKE
ncbi:E3 ubiquitin-protein ligase TRIM35-like isoform X2 [Nerophis ophidion]|uniref:E3 ubiquitin-protein ligase TRIM35-like isoform X2 n=1 Tax=Nerophis ophidion TaxID=159077 RepID=UPI002AE07D82|nr:E3 ubiquitin-protein ligase TRIM35-like isoform X2 [Nerophis ophidion]